LLQAHAFFLRSLLRPNLLRACILAEAEKWAAINEDDIGVADHPHFMNPRLTKGQTWLIIPDAIQIARELKEREANEKKTKNKADKKRKAAMEREERNSANKKSSPRMTRGASARHASWCRKMQGWGDKKKGPRRFY
jgi:hypothetical protein